MTNDWERLLLAHAQVVFSYLLKIGATKEDAEDIVQETLIKTIECMQKIDAGNLRAWLFKVAIHRYYTLYNKQKRTIHFSDEELAQLLPALENIEFTILQKEQNRLLQQAMDTLNPTYQQLLIMKYYMDLSYKEMATILEVSDSHIKTYLMRARKALKAQWEEYINGGFI